MVNHYDQDNHCATGFTSTTGWIAKTVTATIPVGVTSVYVRVSRNNYSSATTFWVDGFQLEQKPYATSFINGTRSPETLTIPTAGVLNPQEGTIDLTYISNHGTNGSGDHFILSAGIDSTSNEFRVEYRNNDRWYLKVGDVVGEYITPLSANIPVALAVRWDSSTVALFVNGSKVIQINAVFANLSLGDVLAIGSSCANWGWKHQCNGLIDELRIDKIARTDEEIQAWYKANAPFYTSEDMKQWPGYVKVETDGLKVYDSSDDLRVLLGSWLSGAIRKYGLKIIGGEIYSSLIRTGDESSAMYIAFEPPNRLVMYAPQTYGSSTPVKVFEMASPNVAERAGIDFYDADGTWYGQLLGQCTDTSINLSSLYGKINLFGKTGVDCSGNFAVTGNLSCTGSKPAQQVTENYGLRYMYATEAPEIIYYDRGAVNLINGEATVKLDPIYLECIEPDSDFTPWQIWVQCYGENDVYVSEVGSNYFKIKERNGGISNNKVVWKHEAIRKGYAGIRLMEVTN